MEKDLGHVRESMIRIRREREGEKKKKKVTNWVKKLFGYKFSSN